VADHFVLAALREKTVTEANKQSNGFTFVNISRDALCPHCRSAVEKRMRDGLDILSVHIGFLP
jgi:hypothetical protein